MSESTIKDLERSISIAKNKIALADALQRLQKNTDFKTVIEQGYLTDEALRLVGLLADPNMQEDSKQASVHTQLSAISNLRAYFRISVQLAAMAEYQQTNDESTLIDVLNEREG